MDYRRVLHTLGKWRKRNLGRYLGNFVRRQTLLATRTRRCQLPHRPHSRHEATVNPSISSLRPQALNNAYHTLEDIETKQTISAL